ncbi:hypothetical protein CH63R_02997 [Colletotrichum higginsianum IMI 349063]|uniref:Uncharacterized protein n=1 Tax=Colletotrichum higginsianum (strain IMI 349063) TaxID=759273 RepID=A0A1B7YQF8_COLHI|nr:hypothetical protein CH63R_02997 [Colletotrichum higginsianum IMI 349063]OBR14271.1 hypothetical protein CH63R_02997 [Colletotrichum higginsianum IMI 349063]
MPASPARAMGSGGGGEWWPPVGFQNVAQPHGSTFSRKHPKDGPANHVLRVDGRPGIVPPAVVSGGAVRIACEELRHRANMTLDCRPVPSPLTRMMHPVAAGRRDVNLQTSKQRRQLVSARRATAVHVNGLTASRLKLQ